MKAELVTKSLLIMYVGNLERYQGIDLLLESFALVSKKTDRADLVIIGGTTHHIRKFQKRCQRLGIHGKVHFLGPKPVKHLESYLSEADILVSPRIKGENTPMKLFSYLHSGKALLATALPTHTQVVDSQVAMLAEPTAETFSEAMFLLIEDEDLRMKLGKLGKKLIEENFTYAAFREKLNNLFDWLETEIRQEDDVDTRIAGRSSNTSH